MPVYTILNKKTGETEDHMVSYNEMERILKKNPHFERVYKPIMIVDPINIGITQPPSDFSKYVLGKVKAKNPHGSVEKRWQMKKEI